MYCGDVRFKAAGVVSKSKRRRQVEGEAGGFESQYLQRPPTFEQCSRMLFRPVRGSGILSATIPTKGPSAHRGIMFYEKTRFLFQRHLFLRIVRIVHVGLKLE